MIDVYYRSNSNKIHFKSAYLISIAILWLVSRARVYCDILQAFSKIGSAAIPITKQDKVGWHGE